MNDQRPTHIDDVVGYLNCCSDKFGQLAAILKEIEKDSSEFSDLSRSLKFPLTPPAIEV